MTGRGVLLTMSSYAQLLAIFSLIWFEMDLLPAPVKSERRFRCISWCFVIFSADSLFKALLWFLNVIGLKFKYFRQQLWFAVFLRKLTFSNTTVAFSILQGRFQYHRDDFNTTVVILIPQWWFRYCKGDLKTVFVNLNTTLVSSFLHWWVQ